MRSVFHSKIPAISRKAVSLLLALIMMATTIIPAFATEIPEETQTATLYTVTLEQSEGGTISLEDEKESPAQYAAGDVVTIVSEADDGYRLDTVSVPNENGETVCYEAEDGQVLFAMPACDVTAVPAFVSVDTPAPSEESAEATEDASVATETSTEASEASDVAEPTAATEATEAVASEEAEEVEVEPAEVSADESTDVTEAYIRENVNPAYAQVEQMVPADILLVKQTLADKTVFTGEPTIDNLWFVEGNSDAFIKLDETYMMLYDVDPNSAYFVACANTMRLDEAATVTDYAFAYNNIYGETVDDCIYDAETGLAYIPKRYTEENISGTGYMNIQLQLLQMYGESEPETTVGVVVENEVKGDVAETGTADTDATLFETSIQLAEDDRARKNVKEEKLTVEVNDVEIPEDLYEYDETTGVLTVGMPATAVDTIKVDVEKQSIADTIKSLFITKAEAGDATAVGTASWDTVGTIKFATTPKKGDTWTPICTGIYYFESGKSTATSVYGVCSAYGYLLVDAMIQVVDSSRATSASGETNDWATNLSGSPAKAGASSDRFFQAALNAGEYNTTKGNKAALPSGMISMVCGHVTTSIGSVTSDADYSSGTPLYKNVTLKCRILDVDTSTETVIVGIISQMSHSQTGVGFYKFKYKTEPQYGYLRVCKKSSDSSNTDNDSLRGAVYGVYSDSECKTLVGKLPVTSDTTGGTNTCYTKYKESDVGDAAKFALGTYYVKEISGPTNGNYYVDTTVHKVTVTANNMTTVNPATVTSYEDPAEISIRVNKTAYTDTSSMGEMASDGNEAYDVSGAEYYIYTTEADAKADTNRYAGPLKVRSDGYSNSIKVDPGTYYIRETKIPDSGNFELSDKVYPVTLSAGDSETVDGTVTVDVRDNIEFEKFELTILKKDAVTGGTVAEGNGELSGVKYLLKYYSNLDGEAEDNVGYFQFITSTYEKLNNETYGYQAKLDDDHKWGTDIWPKDEEGNYLIPYGTLIISEVNGSENYDIEKRKVHVDEEQAKDCGVDVVVNDSAEVVLVFDPETIKEKLGDNPEISISLDLICENTPIYSGISIQKYDHDTVHLNEDTVEFESTPYPGTTFKKAYFDIYYINDEHPNNPVVVNGESYMPGQIVIDNLPTNDNGYASTGNVLPVATYKIVEDASPEGYATSLTELTFSLSANFQNFTYPVRWEEQVIRGDIELWKVNEAGEAMAGIPFAIVRKDDSGNTLETHVMVTDSEGHASTAALSHSERTNANDKCLTGSEPSAVNGVWFSYTGVEDNPAEVDDSLGALPYGSYDIIELPCSANEGMDRITINDVVIEDTGMQSIDKEGNFYYVDEKYVNRKPSLATVALNTQTGTKTVPAGSDVTVTDTISYTKLNPDYTYVAKGYLVDLETNKNLTVNGQTVTAQTTFKPTATDGSATLNFNFNTTGLDGKTLVAVVDVLWDDSITGLHKVTDHYDLKDEPSDKQSRDSCITGKYVVKYRENRSPCLHGDILTDMKGQTYQNLESAWLPCL